MKNGRNGHLDGIAALLLGALARRERGPIVRAGLEERPRRSGRCAPHRVSARTVFP